MRETDKNCTKPKLSDKLAYMCGNSGSKLLAPPPPKIIFDYTKVMKSFVIKKDNSNTNIRNCIRNLAFVDKTEPSGIKIIYLAIVQPSE